MNKRFRSAIIQILKPIGKLDNMASMVPWSVASGQPHVFLAKIICLVLGVVADFVLLSMVSVKETVPTLLKYDPTWAREKFSHAAEEKRKIENKNRIKRTMTDIKIDWMKEYGTDEAIKAYLDKIRRAT